MDSAVRSRVAGMRGRIGFGLLPLGVRSDVPPADAIGLIRRAVEAGAGLLDTADIYSPGADTFGVTETLLGEAVAGLPDADRPIVTTKGGMVLAPDGSRTTDGRPEYLRGACHASLRRLGTDAIDVYQLHRPDPAVPFTDSVGALRDLITEGTIRAAGVSNVTAEQLTAAREILGADLAVVQNKFSIEDDSDRAVVTICSGDGPVYLAWGPLGGVGRGSGLGDRAPALTKVAARLGVSPQRVALAWILATEPDIAPIAGTSSDDHLRDIYAAPGLTLSAEDISEIRTAER